MNSQLVVILVLILIQVLFGINFGASKVIVRELDPIIWSNIRFLVAGVIMTIVTILSKREHPEPSKEFFLPLIPLSLFGMALGQGLFLFGLKNTTSINTAIITTLIPILTLLIVILRGQEKANVYKVSGVILAFIGVLIIRDFTKFKIGSSTFLGDLLVFLGASCFAIYLSYGRSFLRKFDNMWTTSYMFLISGAIMIIFNLVALSELKWPKMDNLFILAVIFSIVGATLLTYFLNNWALRRVQSGNVAVFIYLQPIVAALIGYFYLGEKISTRMIICSLLIFTGLILTIKGNKSKEST